MPLTVHQAVAAIIGDLPAIQKNDRSENVSYKFRGIETLIGHLAPLLARHGVIIVPRTRLVTINTEVENSKGKMPGWTEVILEVTWSIYGPQGDMIEACTIGIGRDNSDKGANKAQTQAYKYLLMELFAIGDKEDDGDGHPQPEPAAATTGPAAPPAAPREAAGDETAGPASIPVQPSLATLLDENKATARMGELIAATPTLNPNQRQVRVKRVAALVVGAPIGETILMIDNDDVWAAVKTELGF